MPQKISCDGVVVFFLSLAASLFSHPALSHVEAGGQNNNFWCKPISPPFLCDYVSSNRDSFPSTTNSVGLPIDTESKHSSGSESIKDANGNVIKCLTTKKISKESEINDPPFYADAKVPLAWLMSFPNSGTTYTTGLIRRVTGKAVATNYLDDKPVYANSPQGPFWTYAAKVALQPREDGEHILTKTHCGDYCIKCLVDPITPLESFMTDCARNLGRGEAGYPYSFNFVQKAVHLFRDPFNNVVSRFHHETKREVRKPGKQEEEEFRNFCMVMNKHPTNEVTLYRFLTPEKANQIQEVPCVVDFIKYVNWHNRAFEVHKMMNLTTLMVHYESYEPENFKETLSRLVSFLGARIVSEPLQFTSVKTYRHFYTIEEKKLVGMILHDLASDEVWKEIKHYWAVDDDLNLLEIENMTSKSNFQKAWLDRKEKDIMEPSDYLVNTVDFGVQPNGVCTQTNETQNIATNNLLLTSHEMESFREQGFLVKRNVVPLSIITEWRKQLWDFFGNRTKGADPEKPNTWPPLSYSRRVFASLHETDGLLFSPAPHEVHSISSLMKQLLGPIMSEDVPPHHFALVNWPFQAWNATKLNKNELLNEVKASLSPAGHLDRFPPLNIKIWDNYEEFAVRLQIYMTDVKPHGGVTKFYNRSHLETHEYFQKNPEHWIYGSDAGGFKHDPGWDEKRGYAKLARDTVNHGPNVDSYTVKPFGVNGCAGDIMIWHANCLHEGSINLSNQQRESVIATFHRNFGSDLPPKDYAKRPGDLFAGWPDPSDFSAD